MKRIIEIECQKCNGTGLYVGCTEKNGAAMVCPKCNGTGKVNFEYNEFTGLKKREDVKRVFQDTLGHYHSSKDEAKLLKRYVLHFSKYGCTYDEWLEGKKPGYMEEIFCPFSIVHFSKDKAPFAVCELGVKKTKLGKEYCEFFYTRREECWKDWHKEND